MQYATYLLVYVRTHLNEDTYISKRVGNWTRRFQVGTAYFDITCSTLVSTFELSLAVLFLFPFSICFALKGRDSSHLLSTNLIFEQHEEDDTRTQMFNSHVMFLSVHIYVLDANAVKGKHDSNLRLYFYLYLHALTQWLAFAISLFCLFHSATAPTRTSSNCSVKLCDRWYSIS